MERTIRAKRIYALGQYQNIEIADELYNVPEKFVLDDTFCSLVSYLQLLNIERRFNRYEIIRAQHRNLSPEEANALIEDELAKVKLELDEYVKAR